MRGCAKICCISFVYSINISNSLTSRVVRNLIFSMKELRFCFFFFLFYVHSNFLWGKNNDFYLCDCICRHAFFRSFAFACAQYHPLFLLSFAFVRILFEHFLQICKFDETERIFRLVKIK